MSKYRTLTDGELRGRYFVFPDDELATECARRFLEGFSQAEYIRELEEEIGNLEKANQMSDDVEFSEYEEVCNERDDLQLQVDTLTATFDALVNT